MVDIKHIEQNEVSVLVVVGEVDASSSIQLDSAIKETLEKGAKKILVDCKSLDYISSAGLGVFMSYIEEMKKHNATMVICDLNEKVLNVFGILGLDQLLTICDNREKGMEILG